MIKVSIIIPIYGVESFIARCACSMLSQTIKDVEFIFVNDYTKDESIEILQAVINQYPERKNQIKIIHHEKNRGLPAARNTGLKVAVGEYVLHCDGDDWIEPTMLEEMYNEAKKKDADIVWCDYYESYKEHEVYKKEPEGSCADEAVRNMLSRTMQYNVWNKLVRRSLYLDNKIVFPEGRSMGEDLTMIKLFATARKICYLPKAYYHYVRWNTGAMTQVFNQKKLNELKENIEDLSYFLSQARPGVFCNEMDYMKLWAKFRFLLTSGKGKAYKMWMEWFVDSNKNIQSLPGANRRIKFLMQMAAKNQWWFVRLHYWILLKGIYSVMHRGVKID